MASLFGLINPGREDEPASKRSKWDDSASVDTAPQKAPPMLLINKAVSIQGLSAKPEYNGSMGVVKEFDSTLGRYQVDIDGNRGTFKLKPDNLFPIAIAGKIVEVQGLVNKPELNGARGMVKEYDANAVRASVEVDGGRGMFKLKLDNLLDVTPVLDPNMVPAATVAPAAGEPPVSPTQPAAPPGSEYRPPPSGHVTGGTFSKIVEILSTQKGLIIGKGGEFITRLRLETGADTDIETAPGMPDKALVRIKGSAAQVAAAEAMVTERLETAKKSTKDKIMAEVAAAAASIGSGDASSNQNASQDWNGAWSGGNKNDWSAPKDAPNDVGWANAWQNMKSDAQKDTSNDAGWANAWQKQKSDAWGGDGGGVAGWAQKNQGETSDDKGGWGQGRYGQTNTESASNSGSWKDNASWGNQKNSNAKWDNGSDSNTGWTSQKYGGGTWGSDGGDKAAGNQSNSDWSGGGSWKAASGDNSQWSNQATGGWNAHGGGGGSWS